MKLADYIKANEVLGVERVQQAGSGAISRRVQDKLGEFISVKDFGAVGDGTTDDTAAIQAAIDYAIYGGGKGRVWVPAGLYKITDTIHLGYGHTFNSVVVEGDGYRYRAEASFSGTALVATFSDRPAIAIQGARGTVVRGLTVSGPNYAHIASNSLASFNSSLDDTDGSSWVDPTLHANADSRYAPCAGVAIDPYSGTKPSPGYPDVTYPEGLGISTQYEKAHSSDVLLEDVQVSGFVVGVVVKPCDADANADFTNLRRVKIESCKYGLSIGHSQSRNVGITDSNIAKVFIGLTTATHGKQIGKLNGTISNLSTGSIINLLRLEGSRSGPLTFLHCYSELIWRLGDVLNSSSNSTSVIFQSCNFQFTAQDDTRGVPANILSAANNGTGTAGHFSFIGCSLSGFPSVLSMRPNYIWMDGTSLNPTQRDNVTVNPYAALAHNATCGGLVIGNAATEAPGLSHRIKFKLANTDTGVISSATLLHENYMYSSRVNCIPIHATTVMPRSSGQKVAFHVPRVYGAYGKGSLSQCSLSGKTLTVEYASGVDHNYVYGRPDVGDVLVDGESGMVFFVKARIGNVITAEAQNNYKSDGEGGYTTVTPFNSSIGTLYAANSRIYTPAYPLFCTVTTGNATLTDCGRADGYAAWLETEIGEGDWVYINSEMTAPKPFSEAVAEVAARDASAKTITISGNASANLANYHLPFFVKKAPANAE